MNIPLPIYNGFYTTVEVTKDLALPLAASIGGGYLYGYLFETNKTIAATAFAISTLTYHLFQLLLHLIIGEEKENPKRFYVSRLVSELLFGSIQIIAYRHLNLIATLGTALICSLMIAGSITCISKLEKVF